MLGWDVRISRTDADGQERWLAAWSAHGLSWIRRLVDDGHAALVEDTGGYPDRYTVTAAEILPMLDAGSRPQLADRVEMKRSGELRVQEQEITRCPPEAPLTVTAWDQS